MPESIFDGEDISYNVLTDTYTIYKLFYVNVMLVIFS